MASKWRVMTTPTIYVFDVNDNLRASNFGLTTKDALMKQLDI